MPYFPTIEENTKMYPKPQINYYNLPQKWLFTVTNDNQWCIFHFMTTYMLFRVAPFVPLVHPCTPFAWSCTSCQALECPRECLPYLLHASYKCVTWLSPAFPLPCLMWLRFPTIFNYIRCMQQPNWYKILIFSPPPCLQSVHSPRIDE